MITDARDHYTRSKRRDYARRIEALVLFLSGVAAGMAAAGIYLYL